MATPSWFWPLSGAAARGVALAPFGSGVAVADWTTPTIWPFSGSAFSAGITLASGTPGLCAAVADTLGGLWALSYAGALYHVPVSGAQSVTTLPSGSPYVGLAIQVGTSGGVYAVNAAGTYYGQSFSAVSGAFGYAAWFAQADTQCLYALQPAASGIGRVTLSTGASGLIAYPAAIPTVSAFAVLPTTGATGIAIAGWANAPALSGMAAAALDPQVSTTMMAVGSGAAVLWQTGTAGSNAWAQTQALTGLVNLSAMAWRPDGVQVLAPSVSSGVVQVIGYSAGVMSLAQTLSLSGACSVAIAGDSAHALVAQSGQAQLATLTYGAIWATGVAVTGLTGITSVAALGASGAVAGYASGLAFLNLVAGVWSVSNTVSVGFTPARLAVDPFSRVYAAGSGSLAVATSGGLIGSGAWAGSTPTGLAVQQGRVIMTVPSDGAMYIFGQSAPNAWTVQSTYALALSPTVGAALSQSTLFTLGSGSTVTYQFSGSQFALTPVASGAVGYWNGTAWTVAGLGVGQTPSALTFDASGNICVATVENSYWAISQAGAVVASGLVGSYGTQPQTVPLGLSALLVASGNLYLATSLPGALGKMVAP